MTIIAMMLPYMAASCIDNHTICHKYTKIKSTGWDTCSYASIYFDDNAQGESGEININVELRTNSGYGFANLWLEVSDNIEDSTKYTADTIELRTADDKGIRFGSNTAGLYQISVPYRKYSKVRRSNNNVRIRHLMSESPLKGIENIGILVYRNK